MVTDYTVFSDDPKVVEKAVKNYEDMPIKLVLNKRPRASSSICKQLCITQLEPGMQMWDGLVYSLHRCKEPKCFSCRTSVIVKISNVDDIKYRDSDGEPKKLRAFDITDQSGTVRAVLYDSEGSPFRDLIKDGQMVRISNPTIKPIKAEYGINYEVKYELSITKYSTIEVSNKKFNQEVLEV